MREAKADLPVEAPPIPQIATNRTVNLSLVVVDGLPKFLWNFDVVVVVPAGEERSSIREYRAIFPVFGYYYSSGCLPVVSSLPTSISNQVSVLVISN